MTPRRLAVLAAAALALAVAGCGARVALPGPVLVEPALLDGPDGGAIIAADGAALPVRVRRPPEGVPVRGVVLALHGLNDHSGNFLDPDAAPLLTRGGMIVYAYDQRGFGRAPNRGLWAGTDALVADAVLAARLVKARHPGLPLTLLGESLGGSIALLAAASDPPPPVDRVVLLAPALWRRDDLGPVGSAGLGALAFALPSLGFPASAGAVRASDNAEALRRFDRDPLTLKDIRADVVAGAFDALDRAARAAPGCCAAPTLILRGERDRVVRGAPVRAALRRGTGTMRIGVYADGWHLLLRDRVRERVAADVLAFVADPRAPLPSGADAAGAAWLAREDAPDERAF